MLAAATALGALVSTACASCRASSAGSTGDATSVIALPGANGGIGFDDLGFAPDIRKVIAPAADTGKVDLIDPDSLAVTSVDGFSVSSGSYGGGHDFGVTSADVGRGFVFATDRTSQMLVVADAPTGTRLASAKLGASPDYARWVEIASEVWITEPDAEVIEVFSIPQSGTPTPSHAANISVKGGPESLVVDASRKKAFTHLWNGATVAIDIPTRAVASPWPNGCGGSRGIAMDSRHGWLFAACAEGSLSVLDVDHGGTVLGSVSSGSGVDVIAYSASLGHVYMPGAASATMAIVAIASNAAPSVLGTLATTKGAHCVATDDRSQVWVCDPQGGRLLLFKDAYAASIR
jgi:DNA-binding beta-propeller fold protein YncE